MTRVSETARITVPGLSHVDHNSPLEEQVQVVYEAAHRYALAHKFKPHTHNGPYGPKKGLVGPFVMKRLIGQLFPGFDEDGFIRAYGLISQVLKKTDGAVCIKRPKPGQGDQQPQWFISDTMPSNLVIVAVHMRQRSAGVTPAPSSFDEKAFLTNREKYKVTRDEAGETLPPAEVTVRVPKSAETTFSEMLQRRQAAHHALRERILDELRTTPIPLSGREITDIINRDPDFNYDLSTYRGTLAELHKEGLVVRRKEEDSERLLRGGGQSMPKGMRMDLYMPAPGPVPVRDRLPAGIEPYRPAAEWGAEGRAQRASDIEAVLDALNLRGSRAGGNPPRTLGRIAQHAGLPEERTEATLTKLIADGVVYQNNSAYYLESRRRYPTPQPELDVTPTNEEPEVLPTEVTVSNNVQPTAIPDHDDLAVVLRLAERLGVALPKGDPERVRELESQLADSNRALYATNAENERLRKQVAALKTAISTME